MFKSVSQTDFRPLLFLSKFQTSLRKLHFLPISDGLFRIKVDAEMCTVKLSLKKCMRSPLRAGGHSIVVRVGLLSGEDANLWAFFLRVCLGYDELFAMCYNFTWTKSGNPWGNQFYRSEVGQYCSPTPPSVPLCSYRAVWKQENN